jgi:2,5-diketo-D-gluconate reductase A
MTDTPTIALNDGRVMPQIGLGLWQAPDDEAAKVIRDAVAAGYRAVDTAMFYHNERGVGEGLGSVETPVHLTTKLWNDDQGYDNALRAFGASLKRLGRETVDLYLIHWPAQKRGLYVETWKALVRLREEGRALSIGVSNFNGEQIDCLVAETGVAPALNQIELHPRLQQHQLRREMAERGVMTQAWSPFGTGALLSLPALADIGAKHGRSVAQVILRWHVQNGAMAVPKSVNPERMRQNLEVFDFALDDEDLLRIAALDDGTRTGPDPANFPDA